MHTRGRWLSLLLRWDILLPRSEGRAGRFSDIHSRSVVQQMNELNPIIEPDIENTSTYALAQELFRASWVHNVGRTVHDVPLWDALDDVAKFHLIETAYAAEQLLQQYDTEEEKLLTWNLAEVLFRAYSGHPAGGDSIPNLPWRNAPNDFKILYYKYAEQVLTTWYLNKHLPRHKGWLEVVVKK